MRQIMIYLILALTSMGAGGFIEHRIFPKPETIIERIETIEIRHKPYLQREEINDEIRNHIADGETDKILEILHGIVGDRLLAYNILSAALDHDIPVGLLLGLIFVESSFNPKAINKHADGKTYDYGLMQLNSKTFSKYTREKLLEAETNLRLGADFLIQLRKKYGIWGEAIIHYNGLYEKGAGKYLVRVFQKEREYEKIFNEKL